MTNKVLFSPPILKCYETLQGFMVGKDEIKEIKANTASTADIRTSLAKKVVMIAISPFCLIAGLFFYISSFCLGLVHANNLSIRCEVLSSHFFYYLYSIKNISILGKDLLVCVKNMPDLSTSDLYLSKKIERKSASKDNRLTKLIYSNIIEKLKEKLIIDFRKKNPHWNNDKILLMKHEFDKIAMREFHKTCKDIDFVNIDGVCFGMSVWFAFLYLNSIQSNQDSIKHTAAVATHFENGAPRQAGLLQSLFAYWNLDRSSVSLLKLQSGKSINNDLARKESGDCLKFLSKLENGVYLMDLEGEFAHAMCFIKEDGHKYIFDPNIGLIKIDDEKTFQVYYNSEIKGSYNKLEVSKLMKANLVSKKASKAPKNLLSRISSLFSKIAA